MPTLRELFVDRDRQIQAFRKMLDGQTSRRVMLVTAEAGMGKSWLLQIFAQEAASHPYPLVQVDFADGQAYDALTLVRRCRDSFGPEHFAGLTQAINDATAPRFAISGEPNSTSSSVNIAVSDQASLNSSPITAEVGTIVKDSFFVIQTDNPLIRQAIEDRINSAFFENLVELTVRTTTVFLFDSYERASLEPDRWVSSAADRWISGQLLARIKDGRLRNAIVVLAGRRMPEFGVEWNEVLGRMTLDLLQCKDVKEYLRERRGLTVITDAEAERLCQAVAGSPQVLGLIGDNLVRANVPQTQDDEW